MSNNNRIYYKFDPKTKLLIPLSSTSLKEKIKTSIETPIPIRKNIPKHFICLSSEKYNKNDNYKTQSGCFPKIKKTIKTSDNNLNKSNIPKKKKRKYNSEYLIKLFDNKREDSNEKNNVLTNASKPLKIKKIEKPKLKSPLAESRNLFIKKNIHTFNQTPINLPYYDNCNYIKKDNINIINKVNKIYDNENWNIKENKYSGNSSLNDIINKENCTNKDNQNKKLSINIKNSNKFKINKNSKPSLHKYTNTELPVNYNKTFYSRLKKNILFGGNKPIGSYNKTCRENPEMKLYNYFSRNLKILNTIYGPELDKALKDIDEVLKTSKNDFSQMSLLDNIE